MAHELEQKEALAKANKDLSRLHAELAHTSQLEKEHAADDRPQRGEDAQVDQVMFPRGLGLEAEFLACQHTLTQPLWFFTPCHSFLRLTDSSANALMSSALSSR